MTEQITQALAAKEYERVVELVAAATPGASTAAGQAELFGWKAQALYAMQRWPEVAAARAEQSRCLQRCAPVDWNRVYRIDYSTAHAWNLAGEHERGLEMARAKLQRVERLGPKAAGDWCGLAAMVRFDQKRFAEAAEYRTAQVDHYERSEPRDAAAIAQARNSLAWACYMARDLDRALEEVRRSRAEFAELHGATDGRTLSALHLHIYVLDLLGDRDPRAGHHQEMLRLCEELVSKREAGSASQEEIDDARRWLDTATKKTAAEDTPVARWDAAKERAITLFGRGELDQALEALRAGLHMMAEFLENQAPEPGHPETDPFWARYFDRRSDLYRLAANVSTHLLSSGSPFDYSEWDPIALAERDLETAWRFRKPGGVDLSLRTYFLLLSKLHVALWRAELHRTGRAGGSAGALAEVPGLLSAAAHVGEQLPEALRSDVVLMDAERAHAVLQGVRKQAAGHVRRVEAHRAVLEEEHRRIGTPRAPVGNEPRRRLFGGGR